ncbi:MAG: hypothetical protein ACR2QU_06770 [Gammaproteobacteria bacterium]
MHTLLIASILTAHAAVATADIRYQITVPDTLDRLDATVCMQNWIPDRLVSRLDEARGFLVGASRHSGDLRVDAGRGQIRLSNASAGDCLRYTVDLAAAIEAQSGDERIILHQEGNVLMSSGVWLWRPDHVPEGAGVILQFDLPEGMQVSVPWQRVTDATSAPTFRLDRSPIEWRDLTAIGYFESRNVDVAGASLRVAVLDAETPASVSAMDEWIREAAGAVSTLYGRFPLSQPQVLVVPIGMRSEAVPWAQVLRGGGAAAHFFVDQHRPLSEFREDWTATHELSHMLLPYVGRRDAWLSEGLASYYQNVLRARADMINEELAWQKLYAGFGRGRRDSGDKSLAEVSRNMGASGGYMRVYWSGAAIVLMADVELRRRSGGQMSLDTAMEQLATCCLPGDRTWSAREVFSRLDDITDSDVFMSLYREHVDSRKFPDISATSRQLGITERGGKLHLSSAGTARALRAAIMSRPKTFTNTSPEKPPAANAAP